LRRNRSRPATVGRGQENAANPFTKGFLLQLLARAAVGTPLDYGAGMPPRRSSPHLPRSPLHRRLAACGAAVLAARAAAADPRPRREGEAERARTVATASCLALSRAVEDIDEAARTRRLRVAPALPQLSLRAHVGDGGYRRLDLENVSTGETLTATRGAEVRLSWSLDDLVYRSDELAQLRLGLERRAHGERLRHHCAELAARWVRARLDPARDEAEERAAYTALDVATGGELTRIERSPPP
jgi:hypothetical protein